MQIYLLPIIITFLLSIIITPFIKKMALSFGIVDKPAPRKIHERPIPLLGGLAVFLSFIIGLIFLWLGGFIVDGRITNNHVIAIILSGIVLMVGGLMDDKFNLKPSRQVIFPVIAAIIIILSGIKIQFITNPFGGVLEFHTAVGTAIAFFWLLGMVYTTKFLDGLDGLVSGVTFIGSLVIFIVSLYWDVQMSGTSFIALLLAGSVLGFLMFNWNPAKIFLGEGGSVFCGFMLGVLAIISGSKIATALLIMGIPILDVLWVITNRILQGKSPVQADKKHLHFRLLDIGFSHKQAVLFLYFVTATFGISSIFLLTKGKIIGLTFLIIVMTIIIGSLSLIYKRKNGR